MFCGKRLLNWDERYIFLASHFLENPLFMKLNLDNHYLQFDYSPIHSRFAFAVIHPRYWCRLSMKGLPHIFMNLHLPCGEWRPPNSAHMLNFIWNSDPMLESAVRFFWGRWSFIKLESFWTGSRLHVAVFQKFFKIFKVYLDFIFQESSCKFQTLESKPFPLKTQSVSTRKRITETCNPSIVPIGVSWVW